MNLLLLTTTYFPETKSAAFMLKALAEEFKIKGNNVTVITFSHQINKKYEKEKVDGIDVIRLRIKDPGFSKVKRALNELTFSMKIKSFLKRRDMDIDAVIFYAPSIFFGSAVNYIKKRWTIKSYLIMRDLFPDWTVKVGLMNKGLIYYFFKYFEKKQYLSADFIGMESSEDVKYCEKFIKKPEIQIEHLLHWVGRVEDKESDLVKKFYLNNHLNLIYGGALGIAQDFLSFLKILNKSDVKRVNLVIVGQGEQSEEIERFISQAKIKNTRLIPSIEREHYMSLVKNADAGLVVLNKNLDAHNYPGKSFEYMYYSKPILAYLNLNNEFGKLLKKLNCGYVIEGGNIESLKAGLFSMIEDKELMQEKGERGKQALIDLFSAEKTASIIYEKFI